MEEKDLQLLEESKLYVSSMGKWMKFFAILGCIGAGFMVLAALLLISVGSFIPLAEDLGVLSRVGTGVVGFIYLIIAAVYIYPIIYLFRASAAARLAIESKDNVQMTEFLKNNKSFWRYCGILTIVLFCFYIVLIIGFIIAGVALGLSSL
jgi:hypothetical protein